jgi:acetolactate synthase-1/2/3 large subunit
MRPGAYWAQIDVDALKRDMPMWGFAADLRLEGDSVQMLQQLIAAVEALATPASRQRAAARLEQLAREHDQRRQKVAAQAAEPGQAGALNPHHVCAALGRALQPADIVLNEAIRNTMAVFEQIPRSEPGTLLGLPGGGLGYSAGMALGLKLANPQRNVVHVVGDGTFYLSNPASVYAVAREYGVPILTVVLDNSGWAAVKEATLRMYPQGRARASGEYAALLPKGMDFAAIAEAAGAHGERLSQPGDIEDAVARCLQALRAGRSALLHAKVAAL